MSEGLTKARCAVCSWPLSTHRNGLPCEQAAAVVTPAGSRLTLAKRLKDVCRRRADIVCGLLTAAACDKLDAERDSIIDQLAGAETMASTTAPTLTEDLRAIKAPEQLVEPVTVNKAMRAHRHAEVWLDGGTGPACCVALCNIQLVGWNRFSVDEAKAYAEGFNQGARAMRAAAAEQPHAGIKATGQASWDHSRKPAEVVDAKASTPARTCSYPDCQCPFDAPADPNWCARGYPKKKGQS